MELSSLLEFGHSLCAALLAPGDLAVDATCGNGHDTLFLAQLGVHVIGCDIQADAIEATRKRLGDLPAELHLRCHSEIGEILGERRPKVALFNLGYLPGSGRKQLTTTCTTTMNAVSILAERLLPGGALAITCYPGHPEGAREEELLIKWASSLPRNRWSISLHRWLPGSPRLLFIQKVCSHRIERE